LTVKSKFGVLALLALLLLSFSLSVLVAAQYKTEKTTDVTIGSDGTFAATESSVGVSYQIVGTPGATGTVTTEVYNGNPQPTASIPSGVSLTKFIVVTFSMKANDFAQATIIISYTSSEVQNLQQPYAIYKYNSESNSYSELPSTANTYAKTITVTLTSITDPLLAIGGTTTASGEIPTSIWIIIAVVVIIVVLVNVYIFSRMRRPTKKSKQSKEYSFK
jgi:hypothetical protein